MFLNEFCVKLFIICWIHKLHFCALNYYVILKVENFGNELKLSVVALWLFCIFAYVIYFAKEAAYCFSFYALSIFKWLCFNGCFC